MPDPTTPPDKPHPTPREGDNVHERPEVKPLVEKAGAEPEKRVPQGTMKTGGDIPGGGAAKPLDIAGNPLSADSPTDKG